MMSDLREALEKLAADFETKPAGSIREFGGLLRDLLAAHPAEPAPEFEDELDPFVAEQIQRSPEFRQAYAFALAHKDDTAPVVTDEAVEAARQAYSDACKSVWPLTAEGRFRAALEAAVPLLGTRPQPAKCANCEAETFVCGACGARLEAY